jgi:hypothetical protein
MRVLGGDITCDLTIFLERVSIKEMESHRDIKRGYGTILEALLGYRQKKYYYLLYRYIYDLPDDQLSGNKQPITCCIIATSSTFARFLTLSIR